MRKVVIAGALVACFAIPVPAMAQEPAVPPSDVVGALRERLGDVLLDAGSAEIRITRGQRRASIPIDGTSFFDGYAFCGTVNAKNRYGAFTGRQPHVFMYWTEVGRWAVWPIGETSVPATEDLVAECALPAD